MLMTTVTIVIIITKRIIIKQINIKQQEVYQHLNGTSRITGVGSNSDAEVDCVDYGKLIGIVTVTEVLHQPIRRDRYQS